MTGSRSHSLRKVGFVGIDCQRYVLLKVLETFGGSTVFLRRMTSTLKQVYKKLQRLLSLKVGQSIAPSPRNGQQGKIPHKYFEALGTDISPTKA